MVMALPAIGMLDAGSRDVVLWAHPRVAGLLAVFFPGSMVFTGHRVPGRRYGSLLLMTDSFRSALQGFLSRVPSRIGYGTDMRGYLLTKALEHPSDRKHHHSMDYLRLAEAVDPDGTPTVPQPRAEPEGEPHVALFPGARYGSAKKWPGFGRLAVSLAEWTGLPVALYGSADEESELARIASGVPGCEIHAGLDLPRLASRLMRSVLTVGNDSGGVHLSAVLDVPTVTIFGSTSPVWTAPSGRYTMEVASELDCSPCFRRSCPTGRAECLAGISPRTVLEASIDLFRRSGAEGLSHV